MLDSPVKDIVALLSFNESEEQTNADEVCQTSQLER